MSQMKTNTLYYVNIGVSFYVDAFLHCELYNFFVIISLIFLLKNFLNTNKEWTLQQTKRFKWNSNCHICKYLEIFFSKIKLMSATFYLLPIKLSSLFLMASKA